MKNCHFPKENLIDKKEVQRFLDMHPDKEFSAAKFEYMLYLIPKAQEMANDFANKRLEKTDEDLMMEKVIAETTEPSEVLRLMRKPTSGLNRHALREKFMEYEEEMLPLIKEKCLRNKQSIFIEHALYFFLHSKINCCDWIMETYSEFHSEYLKSMLCLVFGFRGEVDTIPFLMQEAKRFEREYPDEDYDQGPVLAVQELAVRYLN